MTAQDAPSAAYVLDTWSIMAYFDDEPTAQAIEELLNRATLDGIPLLMTVVNVAEVWYTMARQLSSKAADEGLADLRDLGIQFVPAGLELALLAARFKAKYKMSLADCFGAALAQQKSAELVTGDPEFRQVGADIRMVWM